jgi:hypothetical protein
MSFKELCGAMADFFHREGMDYAVIGAFGLHAYGYTRATRDIDFLTRTEYQEKVLVFLNSLGFETILKTMAFSNHLHPVGEVRVDMMYVEGTTADRMFSDVRKSKLFGDIELPVVSPEHLIALKLFAAYNDPKRKYKEFADIQEIMNRMLVDKSEVREYFKKYGFEEFYAEITSKKE